MEVIDVHKKNLNKLGYQDLLEWLKDPNHIYIGRNMSFYVKGAEKSKWHNPFKMKDDNRDEVCEKYRSYIRNTPELYDNLLELEGKVLGCWCAPQRCHGHILVDLVKEKVLLKQRLNCEDLILKD